MELFLKQGIADIKFGMVESEIIHLLGNPDKIIVDQDSSDELIYQYNTLKLRLSFYKTEGNRLGYIRCANCDLKYSGQSLLFRNVHDVINNVFSFSKDQWEIEEDYFFDTYTMEECWLVLNTEYDEVTDIELGVPFKNHDDYDWPE
ncbi:MAG: hypothetical protein JXR70_15930 [Spirochaetales bacterium]|nr:hypothetical protein [Spirochaetales bacterium]